MATTFETGTPALAAEERFFFKLALLMGLVIVTGFSLNLALGRSTFAVPLVYHVHAFVFFGWIALLLTQSGLAASGNFALHRRLGWLSVIWIPLMVILGVAITVTSLRLHGGPWFFDANEFMISNPISLLTFAALTLGAVAMRKRTDWHRRLMLGGMATILGPGFGRILPTPLFVPWAWEITNLVGLVFILAGMWRDKRHLGMVHPAWLVALFAGIGSLALGEFLAYTDWGIALTKQVMAGYPGAARPMQAYIP